MSPLNPLSPFLPGVHLPQPRQRTAGAVVEKVLALELGALLAGPPLAPAGSQVPAELGVDLGFGRIVGSGIEVPTMLVNLL